jgi:hypothetical protein
MPQGRFPHPGAMREGDFHLNYLTMFLVCSFPIKAVKPGN